MLNALAILYRHYTNPYIIGLSYIFQSGGGLSDPHTGYGTPYRTPKVGNKKATDFWGCRLITNGFFVLKALTILYRLYLTPYIIGSSYICSEWRWVGWPPYRSRARIFGRFRPKNIDITDTIIGSF